MDFDKLYAFASGAFSDYFHVLIRTLAGGRLAFEPIAQGGELRATVQSKPSKVEYRLNPQLFGFLVLSVVLGVALHSLQTRELDMGAVVISTVLLTLSWILYSSFTFLCCRIIGGRGSYIDTVSMMVQLLATVFVVSSFFSLGVIALAAGLARYGGVDSTILQSIIEDRYWPYYLVHTPLLMVYVPIVLRPIHGFSVSRSLLLLVVPLVAALLGLLTLFLLWSARGDIGPNPSLS